MKPKRKREPIAWKAFSDLELIWPTWLVDQLLPRQSLICLYGSRGLGKTFLTLDLALSVATGRSWNGLPVARGRVAYLLAERTDGLKRRMLGWAQHHGLTAAELDELLTTDRVQFVAADATPALDDPADCRYLQSALDNIGDVSLLIADPLVSFASGSENDARDMQRVVAGARHLVDRCGCSILLVHHSGKQDDLFDRGARGSSALEAGMDTVLALKGKGGHPQLTVTKQREHEARPPMTLSFEAARDAQGRELGKFPRLLSTAPETDNGKRRTTKRMHKEVGIIEAVTALSSLQEPWVATSRIIDHAKRAGLPLKSTAIRETLHTLAGDGHLRQERRGNGALYYRLPGEAQTDTTPPAPRDTTRFLKRENTPQQEG